MLRLAKLYKDERGLTVSPESLLVALLAVGIAVGAYVALKPKIITAANTVGDKVNAGAASNSINW